MAAGDVGVVLVPTGLDVGSDAVGERQAAGDAGDAGGPALGELPPGIYTITYIEMDVPNWSREPRNASDFEAYQEIVDDYATG